MKPSARKTLKLKTGACSYCDHADKKNIRQKREYCEKFDVVNGHCRNFKTS